MTVVRTSPRSEFEPLLTSHEAARLLHMHPKTLERMARKGRVPRYRICGRWLFRASELDAWMRSQLHSTPPSVPPHEEQS